MWGEPIMVDLQDFREPVLNSQVVAALESNKPGFDYITWIVYPLLFLIALTVIVLVVIFIIKKIRKNSFSPEFKDLIIRGEIALKNKDLPLASKLYLDMKKMSEKTLDKKMAVISLDFFKKVLAMKEML